MNGFFEECWENLWSGWTPIVVVIFFIVGIKIGGWISGYFNTRAIWFTTKFLLPFIFAACVPFFATLSKNKR